MTTLAVMKQRIADELARNDLTAMIAYAISDAISAYQSKRFFFNETRTIEFSTSDGQEFYDETDHELIPHLFKIDSVLMEVGDIQFILDRVRPETLEGGVIGENQPTSYAYYGQQIRLYPIPDDTYDITICAHHKVDEPASATETNNAWMTHAERLIRARAKYELVQNVNASGLDPAFNPSALMIFEKAERDALRELKGRTAVQVGQGRVRQY